MFDYITICFFFFFFFFLNISLDEPSLNGTDISLHMEHSTNSVVPLSEHNSSKDSTKVLGAASSPTFECATDLHTSSQSLESEKANNENSGSELFDQLIGSFTIDTPVAAEPVSEKKTDHSQGQNPLEDDLCAADFLDSFNETADGETWSRGKFKSTEGSILQVCIFLDYSCLSMINMLHLCS